MSASSSPELADEFEISSYDVAGFAANALRDRQSLAAVLDHTLLKPDATSADIVRLCEEAMHYRFACVSVNPCWIALAHSALSGSGVAVGSVVGFPFGASLTHNKREEGESALRLGARELDMVIHIGALKGGDNATVQSDVRTMVELAHDAGSTLKAILETCLLTLEEKLRASEICVAAGVDFLKTSTGFSTGGATVEDVSLLRGVAGGRCGVKAAGGIRTLDSVRDMLEAGASRIGTSSGVAILESYMEQQRAVESYLSGQSAALSK
ncbi:MAG TPA: deoxyribose-phosphate aldolase [Acidobacteriaceae bacterium]|nr:deoxyribose-phosphate aldolase [Acidobacteriaceae bacterium]